MTVPIFYFGTSFYNSQGLTIYHPLLTRLRVIRKKFKYNWRFDGFMYKLVSSFPFSTEFCHQCDKSLPMLQVILCNLMPLKYRHHSMVYSLPYLLTYIGHAMPMLGQEGGEVCCDSMDFPRNS